MQLGAWWATRIGALLAVIAVVFFGVYVSLGTPPWVKLVELAAVSAGIALGGAWLERRLPRFGSVILGGGLALLFFTALAAYAVPAVKVTDDLAVAAGLQLAAIALVFGVGLRRGSPTVVTMATLMGFVSAFLSVAEGFDDFAVFGALGLAVVAAGFRLARGWAAPLFVASILTHVVIGAVALAIWNSETGRPGAAFAFGIVGAAFAILLASIVIERAGEDGRIARVQRWVQSLNASLAALVGLLVMTVALPGEPVSRYFFVAGAVLFGAAFWARRSVPMDTLFLSFAVKATALITLGVMTEWGARTRWTALLVEAFVLVAAAHRMRRSALGWIALLVWFVSLFFFLGDVGRLEALLLSPAGAALALYVVAGPVLLLAIRRLAKPGDGNATALDVLFGILAAVPVLPACLLVVDRAWGALAMTALALVLVGLARLLRSLVPALAPVALAAFAHAAVHAFDTEVHGLRWMWSSVLVVGGLTAAAGAWAAETRGRSEGESADLWETLGGGLLALGAVALFAGMFHAWLPEQALGGALAFAAVVTWAGALSGRRAFAGAGGVAALLGALMAAFRHDGVFGPARADDLWMWLAAGAAFAVVGGLARLRADAAARAGAGGFRLLSILAGLCAVLALWVAAERSFAAPGIGWTVLAASGVYAAAGLALRSGTLLGAGSLVLAGGMVALLLRAGGFGDAAAAWSGLGAAFGIGAWCSLLPVALERWSGADGIVRGRATKVFHVLVGAGFVMVFALARPSPWASLTTVVWAATGIVLFSSGLFLRAKHLRVCGLLVLAACLPRVFLVDINSTLHRIAAFAVLGGVLLWIGFSYQRFRHFIEDDDAPERPEPPTSAAG